MIGPSLAQLINSLFGVYYIILLIRVIMSWFPGQWRSPGAINFGRAIYGLTEPLLMPIRRALRPYMGGSPIDFSVLILYLILQVAEQLIVRTL